MNLDQYIRERVLADLEPSKYGGRRSIGALSGNIQDPRRSIGSTLSDADVRPVLDTLTSEGAIIHRHGAYELAQRKAQ